MLETVQLLPHHLSRPYLGDGRGGVGMGVKGGGGGIEGGGGGEVGR